VNLENPADLVHWDTADPPELDVGDAFLGDPAPDGAAGDEEDLAEFLGEEELPGRGG